MAAYDIIDHEFDVVVVNDFADRPAKNRLATLRECSARSGMP